MEFIIEITLWFLIEFVFWGFMYWTGYFLILIITIGKWNIGPVGKNKKKRKELKFVITALTGALFWIVFGSVLIIAMLSP